MRGIIIPRPGRLGRGDINPRRRASSESDTWEPVTDSGNPPSEEAPPDAGNPPNSMMPLLWLAPSSSTSMVTDCQKALLSLVLSLLDASLSAPRSSSLWLVATARTGEAPVVSSVGAKEGFISAAKSRCGGASRREEVSWNVMPWGFFSLTVLRLLLPADGAEDARTRDFRLAGSRSWDCCCA